MYTRANVLTAEYELDRGEAFVLSLLLSIGGTLGALLGFVAFSLLGGVMQAGALSLLLGVAGIPAGLIVGFQAVIRLVAD